MDHHQAVLLVIFSLLSLSSGSYSSRYAGCKVIRTQPLNKTVAGWLDSCLASLGPGFDMWRPATALFGADIMVELGKQEELENILASLGVTSEVWIEDVEELAKKSMPADKDDEPSSRSGIIDDYLSYEEIVTRIERVAETHEGVDILSIGQSYEGRDMKIIAITRAGPSAPIVWVQAGIHAREWVAPPVATFLVDRLLWHEKDLLEKVNMYVLPVANPDGYEYTREEDRMWRKTRSPRPARSGWQTPVYQNSYPRWSCDGVDGNRNWPVNHRGDCPTPTTCYKCAETYPGEEPFSEVEVQNIRDFLLDLPYPPVLTESIHSYSQLWMYPYGYADNTFPDNVEEHRELAQLAVDALFDVHGTEFTAENEAELYIASGTAMDWFCKELGATFCFTTELRDKGNFGFLLPADQIVPSGEEFAVGMVAMLEWIVARNYTSV